MILEFLTKALRSTKGRLLGVISGMRINQIARKYGLQNKDVLDYLETIGVSGKSHSSSLDDSTLELVLEHFGKAEKKEPEPDRSESPEMPRVMSCCSQAKATTHGTR